MIVLVSDTSILIDLERGNLLEAAFSCGLTMVVPDLLYDRELEPTNGAFLKKLGLGVVALAPCEVEYAQTAAIFKVVVAKIATQPASFPWSSLVPG